MRNKNKNKRTKTVFNFSKELHNLLSKFFIGLVKKENTRVAIMNIYSEFKEQSIEKTADMLYQELKDYENKLFSTEKDDVLSVLKLKLFNKHLDLTSVSSDDSVVKYIRLFYIYSQGTLNYEKGQKMMIKYSSFLKRTEENESLNASTQEVIETPKKQNLMSNININEVLNLSTKLFDNMKITDDKGKSRSVNDFDSTMNPEFVARMLPMMSNLPSGLNNFVVEMSSEIIPKLKDIDLSNVDISNPMAMFESNDSLKELMISTSHKLKEKIDKGELNEQELKKEISTMIPGIIPDTFRDTLEPESSKK
jgi:hypothetical protein